jgi:hypothetical protein
MVASLPSELSQYIFSFLDPKSTVNAKGEPPLHRVFFCSRDYYKASQDYHKTGAIFRTETIYQLIRLGANPHIVNHAGKTALYYALMKGKTDFDALKPTCPSKRNLKAAFPCLPELPLTKTTSIL